jgi:hypothetical protein
MVPLKA